MKSKLVNEATINGGGFILGISYNYHDSGAVLVSNGQILGAVEEERFTRIKGDKSFPINAVSYLLTQANITPEQLEAVVYYESPYLKFNRTLSTLLLGRLETLPLFVKALNNWLDTKLWVEKDIKKFIHKKANIKLLPHHLSHGASAFYPSPFNDAVVLTIDGVGEWSTTTIGYGEGYKYAIDQEITFPNSLGLLYSAFTHYTGFKINSGEYKMMGLAPYGKPIYVELIKNELIHLSEDGSYSLNPKYFSFDKEERTYNQDFINLFGSPARVSTQMIRTLDQDLAASIQVVLNEALLSLCLNAKKAYPSENLVLAGGVALNVVAVGVIERSGIFKNVWVQPCSGDGGGALGAALYYYHNQSKSRTVNPLDQMHGSFLGPTEGSPQELKEYLTKSNIIHTELTDEELIATIAKHLAQGKIVGLCKGRMEYGPRALGARSILADARAIDMQERLNLKTKFREGFRPFAPMILAQKVNEVFEYGTASPYMLKTYFLKEEYRYASTNTEDIIARVKEVRSPWPAITHIDYSCRVQTIDAERNPFIYKVLSDFYQQTGSPIIVNTSFNVRGEPIVLGGKEAIDGFLNMDIDTLVVGNFLVEKSLNPNLSPTSPRIFGED